MKKIYLFVFFLLLCFVLTAQDRIKVACIGNSVTYGYGHSNPAETSYPVSLGKLLGNSYDVRNFGYSGATLLRRGHRPYVKQTEYSKALEFAPDMAVIHLGLNDTDPRNWPNYRDEFVPDYLALIDTLRAVNPDVKIWICRMTPIFSRHRRFKSGTREWFWQIQNAIAIVAQKAGVGLIDLHEPLYGRPDLFADALHPNAEGAQIIANTVYSAITGNYGGLSLPSIYSDGMVVQRDVPFTVCGKADAGATIKARMGGQVFETVASSNGTWNISFGFLAVGKTYTLEVSCGREKKIFNDIVAGEVWLCSGQSNMEWPLKRTLDGDSFIAEAPSKNIRIFDMKARVHTDNVNWEQHDLQAINRHEYFLPSFWQKVEEENIAGFSAVAYHFGAMLADSLNVPIGLICNAVGGAPIEAFIDRKTMEADNLLVDILENWRESDFVQEWVRGRAALNIQKSDNPLQRHPYEPCFLYETGIEPITCYRIKGVIWYQGESNAHNVELYEESFPVFVNSWRRAWNNWDMPFYTVQLSSINRPSWPHFRDAQRRLSHKIERCYMAVSSDKGDSLDVHPRNKQPIGERLARLALYNDYGFNGIVPSGPVLRKAENEGHEIVLYFDFADGLRSSDGSSLRTFEVAGDDGIFYPANTIVIDGDMLRLSSSKVEYPLFARYGWQPFTRANLVNGAELPASTFEVVSCEH